MKLAYLSESHASIICLSKETHQIELYLKQVDDRHFALVMLSGDTSRMPSKSKMQSPYHSLEQARAAVRAIATQCRGLGYREADQPPIWQIPAQRLLKAYRATRSGSSGDYDFRPSDVYF